MSVHLTTIHMRETHEQRHMGKPSMNTHSIDMFPQGTRLPNGFSSIQWAPRYMHSMSNKVTLEKRGKQQ